jgi:hypothetical protein
MEFVRLLKIENRGMSQKVSKQNKANLRLPEQCIDPGNLFVEST